MVCYGFMTKLECYYNEFYYIVLISCREGLLAYFLACCLYLYCVMTQSMLLELP